MPLLLALSVPAPSWARIGGGQHYRSGGSNRTYGSRSTPSSGGGHTYASPSTPRDGSGDLGGVVFYLVAVTVRNPGLMCPLWIAAGLVLYSFLRRRNYASATQKATMRMEF